MNKRIHHLLMADGTKIYYEKMGHGEPLVLLHGNGGSSRYFSYQRKLSQHFELYIIDVRGRGQSTDNSRIITYDLMTQDLLTILNHEQLNKVHLLGFSDGANLALLFAQKYPERIKSLILNAANQRFQDLTKETQERFNWSQKIMYYLKDFHPFLKKRHHYFNLAFANIPIDEEKIKSFTFPVLILVGENDIVDLNFSKKLAHLFKNSTLIVEPNVGHMFARQKPKKYNQYVLNFLNKVTNN